MNQDEVARNQWWDGLSATERATWEAQARSAGVSAWKLKKASIFDRGVSFAALRHQLGQGDGSAATPKSHD